ncbi:hypothetical protein CP970_09405 [Streptomyces kanamyceticus]|uniref:Uncharacterized protein n=1 Tax=Streptomyces kanamyceticus TaxID=1967 RepID=A0A5J6GAY2_STRKN|nr:hypothetical protein CP970_09405 [Streptomyces kanamyceticus]
MSSTPGWGADGVSSRVSVLRRTPRSCRISCSAVRPDSSRVTSASRAVSGSRSRVERAPPDIRYMVVMWWATMSCSSRAMRRRSSVTARSASRFLLMSSCCFHCRTPRPTATMAAVMTTSMAAVIANDSTPFASRTSCTSTQATAPSATARGPQYLARV